MNSAPADARSLVFDAAVAKRSGFKPTLKAMHDQIHDEASRIETVQTALIEAGMRTSPDDGQIAKLIVWDALGQIVELFLRHEKRARTFFRDLEAQQEGG